MSAGHGDDLRLLDEEILGAVGARAEKLEGAVFLQLLEDLLDVLITAFGDLQILLHTFAREERLWSVREEGRERKNGCDSVSR